MVSAIHNRVQDKITGSERPGRTNLIRVCISGIEPWHDDDAGVHFECKGSEKTAIHPVVEQGHESTPYLYLLTTVQLSLLFQYIPHTL